MDAFWDSSWEKLDSDRLIQYIDTFDFQPDSIIESLRAHRVRTVCDAGCGCGVYALKLVKSGFDVSGFDVSSCAVRIANQLLEKASAKADLKAASILSTGYPEGAFDAIVSRDVIDHMGKQDGSKAVRELLRIVKPGGIIAITLDHLDAEYEAEPHIVNSDGDFVFTDGKWKGMIFHPYTEQELLQMIPSNARCRIANGEQGIIAFLQKP